MISFLIVLVVALIALMFTIIALDRVTATADAAADAVSPIVSTASNIRLRERLELLLGTNGLGRVEVYKGNELFASAGPTFPTAELLTRPVPGGRMLFYFEVTGWARGRRTALVVGALATVAAMSGLILFTLYIPRFFRPIEEMLEEANRLGANVRGDHDAHYLVQTFREAVERIQQQTREIDELRKAASRSPDITELSRTLSSSMSSGFLALDAHGNVAAINDAGREILGIANDPFGESISSGAFPAAFAAMVRESLDTRVALTRREVQLDAGKIIGITTVPLVDGGSFLGLLALYTDLAGFRAMEGRLRDLEALVALGQMSAGIAHEFRNSLFTILGYLRLAARTATDEQTPKLRSAEEEAQKLAGAVDALLNFSKPLKLVQQRLLLDEIVRAVMDRSAAGHPEIEFVTSAANGVAIKGDRELLEVALENIIRNAIDAVREKHPSGGGRIEATLEAAPHPIMTIKDNGIGIDAERAAGVLLPFQSTKPEGIGLGLPLARKIVLQHGGALTLSGTPGEGAVVTLEFF